jgi:hypothetical protein
MTRREEDEMASRANMEASENRVPPIDWGGRAAIHRVELDRVATALGSERAASGYSRLELMLTAVLPRLVGEPR